MVRRCIAGNFLMKASFTKKHRKNFCFLSLSLPLEDIYAVKTKSSCTGCFVRQITFPNITHFRSTKARSSRLSNKFFLFVFLPLLFKISTVVQSSWSLLPIWGTSLPACEQQGSLPPLLTPVLTPKAWYFRQVRKVLKSRVWLRDSWVTNGASTLLLHGNHMISSRRIPFLRSNFREDSTL